jgi:hypothetical protein
MKEITVSSWQQFQEELRALVKNCEKRAHEAAIPVSSLLFRGHGNDSWGLMTTLERHHPGNLRLDQYYRLIEGVKPQLESLTERRWSTPTYPEYLKWLDAWDDVLGHWPAYDYMAHLRHQGFPSPLLDWTRSPYIAAFFAFRHARDPAANVSIFVYWEFTGGAKVWSKDEPHIHSLGPYVRSHPRHFLQQSEYTICVVHDGKWRYASHQDAFTPDDIHQDALWKLTIPAEERRTALRFLDELNLNAYSLFGSEESLVETLAFRELEVRELGL